MCAESFERKARAKANGEGWVRARDGNCVSKAQKKRKRVTLENVPVRRARACEAS